MGGVAHFRLRPGRPDDLEFVLRVHRDAMGPHIERTWGRFDVDEQRKRVEASTDPESHQIVELDGAPVGCLWVRRSDEAIQLVRIWLLSEVQGRGIGTELVRDLVDEARASRRPLRLRVLIVNPARRLYERLGLEVTGQTETHYQMELRTR